jgi:hypothetical protein
MNGYETAQALQITGTDSEVVATLQSLSRGNISANSVRSWMLQGVSPALLAYDGSQWYGTLQDMIAAGTITGTLLDGLRYLKALMLQGGELRTTVPAQAVQTWSIVSQIAALVGGDQSATIDSFYALDGGRPFKSLTATEYQSQRSDSERLTAADQYAAQKLNDVLNPAFSDPSRTVATIQAAFTAAATVTI